MKKPASKGEAIAQGIGGVLVGLDYQIFHSGKLPAELVEHARPDGSVATADGGRLTVGLPEGLQAEPEPAGSGPAGDGSSGDRDS
jgi:hypothetical protein